MTWVVLCLWLAILILASRSIYLEFRIRNLEMRSYEQTRSLILDTQNHRITELEKRVAGLLT